ncbi:hypothetical protein [Luteimonas deserti]|uniref:Uncharacterized protein n=1 Tax=Luteimonas deserti TaxID=2752306 RepID=A0A7Z0TXK1_9GAMM|nr:hypothetical protein [Luteimonas deserti]NYZ61447.1 hypothetical protein [Luteimonas deserti]
MEINRRKSSLSIAASSLLLSATACATNPVLDGSLADDLSTLVAEISRSPASLHQTLVSKFGEKIDSPESTIELGPLITSDAFKLSNVSIRRGLPHYSKSSSVVMSVEDSPCYAAESVRKDFSIGDTGTVQQVEHGLSGGLQKASFFDWMSERTTTGEIKFFYGRSECITAIQINFAGTAR